MYMRLRFDLCYLIASQLSLLASIAIPSDASDRSIVSTESAGVSESDFSKERSAIDNLCV